MTRRIRLKAPWPFLYSVREGKLIENLPPVKKLQPLRRVRGANKWEQQSLLEQA